MPFRQLDRGNLIVKSLAQRANKLSIVSDRVSPEQAPRSLPAQEMKILDELVGRIRVARQADKPVVMAFGAHTIKNGLAPVLIKLMEQGWITHLATNGAGIIHDWEFSFLGQSSEDVKGNVSRGEFGIWQETGFFINLSIGVGAYEGLGYGESVGKMIEQEGIEIPESEDLRSEISDLKSNEDRIAAAADLLGVIRKFNINPGWMAVPHPFKAYSAQAAAFRLGIPFTGHPMIGHDIIYNHPMNHGAAIGRTALRDFLVFADSISRIQDGVYLSVGSAVMSPMIFEKALSMSRNVAHARGGSIEDFSIHVVDLAESSWDWTRDGEPPQENPAYYLRFCKTFSRMGGRMTYTCADNRSFLVALLRNLEARSD